VQAQTCSSAGASGITTPVTARPIAGEEIRQSDPDGPQFGFKLGNAGSAPLDAAHNCQQDVGEGLASIAVVATLNLIARPRQQLKPGTLNARYHFRSPFVFQGPTAPASGDYRRRDDPSGAAAGPLW
jgi:hypothetical protein